METPRGPRLVRNSIIRAQAIELNRVRETDPLLRKNR